MYTPVHTFGRRYRQSSSDSGPPDPGTATVVDPGLQPILDTTKAPNAFGDGQAEVFQGFSNSADPIPDL